MVGRGDRSGSHRNVCVKAQTNISDGWFSIHACPTYAQMSIISRNSNSPPLWDFSFPLTPLSRRQEHNPRHGGTRPLLWCTKALLNPSSAALCLCKASSPEETPCCTAARLHYNCTLCSCCFPSQHFPPSISGASTLSLV